MVLHSFPCFNGSIESLIAGDEFIFPASCGKAGCGKAAAIIRRLVHFVICVSLLLDHCCHLR